MRGNSSEIHYRRSRLPRKFQFGPKKQSDYTTWSYEDKLVEDDYGSFFDPQTESPDMDLGPGVLDGRAGTTEP